MPPTPPPNRVREPSTVAEAFRELESVIAGLPANEVLSLNLGLERVVPMALATAERLEPLVPQIERELPKFDLDPVVRLRIYASAALHAGHQAQVVRTPDHSLIEECVELRGSMLLAAELLVRVRLADRSWVADIRSGTGHQDIADDLHKLSRLFDENWLVVKDKVPFTRAEVERAEVLAKQLLTLLGRRGTRRAIDETSPARIRDRAFTCLVNAYDRCRRAVVYLRWEQGDADVIAPSLYKKQKRRRKKDKPSEDAGEA